ncbi:acetyl-CoA synthetase-like protein [Xylaria telfairii]|nr:acetyl-CoA synthetase-like protein [Xylaria telfairii]
MMMAQEHEPQYGRRLLPLVLRELAQTNPDRLYAAIPRKSSVEDGFVDITVGDLSRCVDLMAHWLSDRLGPSDQFETLCYIGISDLRGAIVFLAAVLCGYKLLLPSPRNPPSTTISLLEQTKCTKILFTSEVSPIVKSIQALKPDLEGLVIPSFRNMMDSIPQPYPYSKTFEEARNDPIVILHSSGSTGLPKPIVMTHGTFATADNDKNLPVVPNRKPKDSRMWEFDGEARVYTIFPFFHLGGFIVYTVNAIFRNTSLVIGPPHMIPDGTLLKAVMTQQKLRAMFLVPSVIEQLLVQEPESIELFRSLDFVASSGAPSNPVIGERLSQVVDLFSPFGSTEILAIPELALPREDWEWHEFHPDFNAELQLYDAEEGLYELVVTADDKSADFTALSHNLPGITTYRTKDLFTRHPTRPRLFKYHGRCDDIIVLANGEKFNPTPLEMNIQHHPALKGALVIGNKRVQSTLLVEPKDAVTGDAARSKLLDDIWPLVQEANNLVLGPGRVQRGKLLCASADKPFVRTAKGTIVRKLTEALYASEIEDLYSSTAAQERLVNLRLIKPIDDKTSANYIREILALTFPQGSDIDPHEDFYAYGLDSVQTIEIIGHLRRSLEGQTSGSLAWITPHVIYRNPTIADLSLLLLSFLNDGIVPQHDRQIETARLINETVTHYVEGLPSEPASSAPVPSMVSTSVVAIIGSTGYLGTHTLIQLLRRPDITHVYCLNRNSDAQIRQSAALASTDVDGLASSMAFKLVYMKIELGKPHLGLEEEQYEQLVREVDVIVFNSWRLDFGLSIKSFSPFLTATRDLIDLAYAGSRKMRIVFISSMSSVGTLASKAIAPEAPVEDPLAAIDMGYAQSKLVAERILTIANQRSGIPVSIVRVCQLGGPFDSTAGAWAEQPWISALLRTAKTLKRMPSNLGFVDWMAIDIAASMLNAFIIHPAERGVQVYNLYPPNPQPWTLVCDFMREEFGIEEQVSMEAWVQTLQEIRDPTASDVIAMPALKILSYFETMKSGDGAVMSFATDKALGVSQVEVPALDKATLQRWLRDWNL